MNPVSLWCSSLVGLSKGSKLGLLRRPRFDLGLVHMLFVVVKVAPRHIVSPRTSLSFIGRIFIVVLFFKKRFIAKKVEVAHKMSYH